MDFKGLIDGGIIAQWSFVPQTRTKEDLKLAECVYKEKTYRIKREPTDREYADMLFGWLVESGITSNSVIYVKNGDYIHTANGLVEGQIIVKGDIRKGGNSDIIVYKQCIPTPPDGTPPSAAGDVIGLSAWQR